MKKLNLFLICGALLFLLLGMNLRTIAEKKGLNFQTPSPTPIYCPPDPIVTDKAEVFLSCPKNLKPKSEECNGLVMVRSNPLTFNPNKKTTYHYSVSAGKVIGKGRNVTWDLSNAKLGTQTIKVRFIPGEKYWRTSTKTVTVRQCMECE